MKNRLIKIINLCNLFLINDFFIIKFLFSNDFYEYMSSISNNLKNYFGPWAVIAGASEGLGAAYAKEVASKGINVVLIARRKQLLDDLSNEIKSKYQVETKVLLLDLASSDLLEKVQATTKDLDIGLLIYDAVYSLIGAFHNFDIEQHLKTLAVNCKAPMLFAYYFGNKMKERGSGGIILMSSLAGLQGNPIHAHYSATKGYNMNLAEALWYEMKPYGVKVMSCNAGPIKTPNYINTKPKRAGLINPKPMAPSKVAKGALKALWKNKPYYMPGFQNKFNAFIMTKILSRKTAIKLMGNVASKMYGEDKNHSGS
ncbi:MAG: SDR family NAD(P)-dependent oxidoreductase [Asgard group archaeon]|nr:SDR family NAD(P)-dependent oxidoreductase [Asgard group archaeon]